ncbi:probable N-acetyltransferase camello [Heterodontus francisci]|uniref:probable N-acetyltransferase camello n=1 Tax=Heterodontus francisci TaxID=7792 RepID=UPI00355C61DC
MVKFRIRLYQDSDYQTVRDIYATGVRQHVLRACRHLLKQTLLQASLALIFCLLLIVSNSLVLSLTIMGILLGVGRQLVGHLWSRIIQHNLREDLLDIRAVYMKQPDACFWVAECDGAVVGTVGAAPSKVSPSDLELKRMNVIPEFRGQGIAKALCHTVLEFASHNGFSGIVLGTSVIQTEAQSLYHKMGYRLVGTVLPPHPLAKLTNYTIYKYRYQIQGNPEPSLWERTQYDDIRKTVPAQEQHSCLKGEGTDCHAY